MDCQLENPFQNLWLEFICTGLRKHMYSTKTAVSKRTQCFGKDIWMMFSFRVEGKEGRFGVVCNAVEWDRK